MFAKKVYQWNAVDVVRSNGEVHRGLVVDKQEFDLLVDFDIAGKAPELVPCQNAYLSNDNTSHGLVNFDSTVYVDNDVVILMKLSKDQPWKWFSGNALVRPFSVCRFALATVRLGPIGDKVIAACVRSECVRKTAFHGRPMRKNDFVREACTVPVGFSYDTQSIAPWRKRFPHTHPIGVVDDTFHFLQLRYDDDFDVSEMASAFIDGIPKEHEMDATEDHRGVKRPHENITSNEDAETSGVTDDFSISDLPLDILGVVFSVLDGRQQTRMRRVCPAWNFKILAPECSREMIVDLRFYREHNQQYILGAWLFHRITEWTKYVTIMRDKTRPVILSNGMALSILKYIMKLKNPLSALVFYNMQLEPTNILTESRTAISEDMQKVCNRVIFKDVTLLDLFNVEHYYSPSYTLTNTSEEDLRIAYGSVSVGSQKELLDCFEAATTEFADPKHHDAVEKVSKAIIQTVSELGYPVRNVFRHGQIFSALENWQKNDVRFGPNTEWKQVQLAQLAANLLSLRNTTLSVLVCLAKGWKREEHEDDELDVEGEDDDVYDEEDDYYNEDSDAS